MKKDIESRILENMAGFSKGQKKIAAAILNDYDKAAYMTAARLGQLVEVSESTVVRFAIELGYDGYPALQKALQEMIYLRQGEAFLVVDIGAAVVALPNEGS